MMSSCSSSGGAFAPPAVDSKEARHTPAERRSRTYAHGLLLHVPLRSTEKSALPLHQEAQALREGVQPPPAGQPPLDPRTRYLPQQNAGLTSSRRARARADAAERREHVRVGHAPAQILLGGPDAR